MVKLIMAIIVTIIFSISMPLDADAQFKENGNTYFGNYEYDYIQLFDEKNDGISSATPIEDGLPPTPKQSIEDPDFLFLGSDEPQVQSPTPQIVIPSTLGKPITESEYNEQLMVQVSHDSPLPPLGDETTPLDIFLWDNFGIVPSMVKELNKHVAPSTDPKATQQFMDNITKILNDSYFDEKPTSYQDYIEKKKDFIEKHEKVINNTVRMVDLFIDIENMIDELKDDDTPLTPQQLRNLGKISYTLETVIGDIVERQINDVNGGSPSGLDIKQSPFKATPEPSPNTQRNDNIPNPTPIPTTPSPIIPVPNNPPPFNPPPFNPTPNNPQLPDSGAQKPETSSTPQSQPSGIDKPINYVALMCCDDVQAKPEIKTTENTIETPYGKIQVNHPETTKQEYVDKVIYKAPQQLPNPRTDEIDLKNPLVGDGVEVRDPFKELVQSILDKTKEKWDKLKDWIEAEAGKTLRPTGDPIIFTLDGSEAYTIKREMGSDDYWSVNLYNDGIYINLEREICDSCYLFGIDGIDGIVNDKLTPNGKIDTKAEMLWLSGGNAYEVLWSVDNTVEGNMPDGFFNELDAYWEYALVMDSKGNHYHPEELGISEIRYIHKIKEFYKDDYGLGAYMDKKHFSTKHFRAMAWCEDCITLNDGSTVESFGIVQGALRDCTVNDINYHIAEKHTGEYLRVDNPVNPISMYEDSIEYCESFKAAQDNPSKYLSHWYAGIASMKHKLAIEDGTTNMDLAWEARELYKGALTQMPSNPFYNVDYCLLQYHMSLPYEYCIKAVEKAIHDRDDVEWFKVVHEILTKNVS